MSDAGGQVTIGGDESATARLYGALVAAREQFPDELGEVELPDSAERFKKVYPDVLPEFEAARADASNRASIAEALATCARGAAVWRSDGEDDVPLAEHLAATSEPLDVDTVDLPGTGRLRPRVPFDGTERSGPELVERVQALVSRGSASAPVAAAIERIVDAGGNGGIDLSSRRIAVLGAAAELAPTAMWLEGGADVLWIDINEPPEELRASERHSGTLRWVPGGADLLTDPARIVATIAAFAGSEPVDIGLYAYAPGRAREWRLTMAMNAIVDALPPGLVRGVAMLVSPTTCGVLTSDDLAGEQRRRDTRPRWQRTLDRLGAFGRGEAHARHGSTCAKRAIVSIQGGSYQAAQYLGKLMAAEAWAGKGSDSGSPSFEVSANTAGISLTDSLHHPVFDTAFRGAAALGVETFDPATTAHLNGLLTLHDRLVGGTDGDPDTLFATRVHGGIYEAPYAIEPALRVATAIGVGKDPRRLPSLFKR